MLKEIKQRYLNIPIQLKASLWAIVCGVLQKGVSVITTPIFTRLLSTTEYGQYNVFTSWMSIISIIVTLCLSTGVFEQGLVKFEEDKKVFASSMQGLNLTLFALWLCIYLVFHHFWNELFGLTTVQMTAMFISIWLNAVFGFWCAEKKNEYKYKALVAYTLITSFINPVVSIILVLNSNDKVTARIIGGAAVLLLFNLFLFFEQMKRGRKFFSAKYWKYALCFNLPLVPHYLSQVILNNSDRIMIEKIVGKSEAGIYSLAYSVSMVMLIFNSALMQSIGPWFYRKIKSRDYAELSPIAYGSLIGVAAANFLLITLAPDLIRLFAPPEYNNAVWIVPPVALSVYYIFTYDLFARFAFYFEKRAFITAASAAGAVLNIILNFIFIKRYGYIAAGYTTLICYMIYSVGHYLLMNRICRTCCGNIRPFNAKIVIGISAVFTLTGFLMMFTYSHFILRYSVIGIMLLLLLAFRRRIYGFLKMLLSMKNDQQVL